jgi:hypothetical protein
MSSSYSTYVPYLGGIINAGDPNQIVPSRYLNVGQGFIVKTDIKNSIVFKNGIRITKNNNSVLRTNSNEVDNFDNIEKHKIYLNLTNNAEFSSNVLIGYLNGATTGIDPFVEGRYINDSPNALTSLINGEEYTIQGRGLPFDVNDVVPLGFKTQFSGNYSLSLASVSGFFAYDQNVFVEDAEIGIRHSLKESPYNFTTSAGVFNNRFKIVYQPNSLGTIDINTNPTEIYCINGILTLKNQTLKIEEYVIYDLLGRKVLGQNKIQQHSISKDLSAIAKQPLLLKVKLEDGSVIHKKIIN